MAYVPVPKDLTKVKTKVAFNLTKRQLICFGSGALIGVPLFFLLRGPVGNSVAAMCMMLVMLPFFMLAMYEKHGQPLEKIVGNIIKVAVIRPKERPYKNLFLYTKMRNVAGLSTSDAQKSSDMFAKCRYMDELTGNRGVIFATGTPVSNSMTELYTMQRYLQYDRLQELNMTHFDCWASRFGETVTALELAPEGYNLIGR